MTLFLTIVISLISQSMERANRNGERMHPCFTPEMMLKPSGRWLLQATWHWISVSWSWSHSSCWGEFHQGAVVFTGSLCEGRQRLFQSRQKQCKRIVLIHSALCWKICLFLWKYGQRTIYPSWAQLDLEGGWCLITLTQIKIINWFLILGIQYFSFNAPAIHCMRMEHSMRISNSGIVLATRSKNLVFY